MKLRSTTVIAGLLIFGFVLFGSRMFLVFKAREDQARAAEYRAARHLVAQASASADGNAAPLTAPSPTATTDVVVYQLHGAKASELKRAFDLVFPGELTVEANEQSNSLIVQGVPEKHEKFRTLLRILDGNVAAKAEDTTKNLGQPATFTDDYAKVSRPEPTSVSGGVPGVGPQENTFNAPNTPDQSLNQQRIEAALGVIRNAQNDEQQQEARRALRAMLSGIFREDMEARDRQVAQIEARIATLRQQYQVRNKLKEQIIDLQLKVLEYQSTGLGFPIHYGGVSRVGTDGKPLSDLFGQADASFNRLPEPTQAGQAPNASPDDVTAKIARLKSAGDLAVSVQPDKVEVPDSTGGLIRFVDQTNGLVGINLGSSDKLTPRATLQVYKKAAEGKTASKDDLKGAIEITKILGPHFAEGRILKEATSPIEIGDSVNLSTESLEPTDTPERVKN